MASTSGSPDLRADVGACELLGAQRYVRWRTDLETSQVFNCSNEAPKSQIYLWVSSFGAVWPDVTTRAVK